MANGDDGYSDAGGGGSVWCDFHVSEVDVEPTWRAATAADGHHRDRKVDHNGYRPKAVIVDKYTEHKTGDTVTGHGELKDPTHALLANQGAGYFVMVIDNATQIERVEVDGDTLRIYLPVVNPKPAPPPGQRVRQVSMRWGLRKSEKLGTKIWANLKNALLATPGVANVTNGGSIEQKAAATGSGG